MKNKSRWLALMLTGSMMISPLSYTRTYAAENEQQYETNLQETVEVEEADLDKKQDESQTEDAGNVKEYKGKSIYIYFEATLDNTAAMTEAGNPNNITLDYSNAIYPTGEQKQNQI